jgi:hypothetical protein
VAWSKWLRKGLEQSRSRRYIAAALCAAAITLAPEFAAAQDFFQALFGGIQQSQQQQRRAPAQANFFADPFGFNQQQQPAPPQPAPRQAANGGGSAFCVRPCDGKYFPLQSRAGATPAQMCRAFCPAGNAKVYFGSHIESATASDGESYADSDNAFAFRTALKPDCTCNGRDPAGLAPVDLSQDTSLRAGDVVATADGLVAYTGVRLGVDQKPDFAAVADYPGLTAALRARLGEMKVTPVTGEVIAEATAKATSHARRADID